ncbi:MAG: efflux RND transporter permease subunit [Gammaproteobacteria bacterium]|nr:efflux RND transporter permease subunit [Gammaproteobacteria bacterium]
MKAIIHFLVVRPLIVNLVSVFLLILGLVVSLQFLQIEAFPNVNLDIVQIDTVYPGASPKEIEQLVVTPIEQELKALHGIDKMISMSFPGSARITMELDPDATNRSRLTSEISIAVDKAKLPSDLPNDPFVTEVDGAVFPVIRLAISAPLDELALKRLGDDIKDDLLAIKGIAKVVVQGDRKPEYSVMVDPDRMQRQRISIADISSAIKSWNINAPGGDLNTSEGQRAVRLVGEFSSVEDASQLVLRANADGNVLRLGDVATISESLVEPFTLHDVAGEPALSVLVLKKANADIIDTVDLIESYIETVPGRYGEAVHIKTFQDYSRFARMRLNVLTNNGMVGLVLVFVSLLLFLRFSVAMTTTWGLPIIFMTGITILYATGMTLNMISMMGFIMVLGMLVDDAIIIGENITHHMERGLNPVEAAVKGSVELIGPVTTTVLTTIAAFLPMMFMTGMIGKFIIAIPIVVITLLSLSWLESFLILPSHVAHVTNPDKHPPERRWLLALENAYAKLLAKALRFRWLTVGISFAVLIGAIVLAKTSLSFQLFPPVGVEEFIARVTAPPGTSLVEMREHLRSVDRDLRSVINPENLETTLSDVGDVSFDQGDPLTQRGSRYGQIRAIYTPASSRQQHDALLDMKAAGELLKNNYPNLDISMTEIRPGPPLGRALEAEISSSNEQSCETAATRLIDFLKTVHGVTTIDSGLNKGDDELHVVLDRELATYAGVDLATAASHVRAAVGGLVVSNIRRGTEEIDVTIRYPESENNEFEQLKNVLIPNKKEGLIPLNKIARFEQHDGFTTIRHKDGIRIVNVVADIDSTIITSRELNKLVMDKQMEWVGSVASDLKVKYGGEEEKSQESFVSLLVAFAFALIAIFFILAIQFNNMAYPLIVMLAIPFGAIGIIISFYLHDLFWKPMPLSFFSSFGMVALTGVVVNSSLILLVFIQRARQDGIELIEAIIMAGRRRLRAVLLTAATTVVGLLPTAYGWGGMDHFVSPMALALSWGLMFSTAVTLITIPAVLAAGHDVRNVARKLFGKRIENNE